MRSRISIRGYVRRSVGPLVCPSVRPSVRPSVTHELKSRNWAVLGIEMVQEGIEHESMAN